MKRRSVLAALALAAASLAGSASLAQQPLTLRFGHNLAVGTPLDLGAKRFAKLVEERSGGKILIRDYPGGQIGNEQQMLEGVQIGTLDMTAVVGSTYGNVLPEANVLGVLFLFRDLDHMLKTMNGPVGAELAEKLNKKTSMHVIDASWYLGTRQLTSANPVSKPEDMAGVKIRVVPVPIFEAGWRAVGATPTPIDYKDLFTSLQTNVVSAQENPLAVSKAAGVQLVLKNLSMTDHVINNVILAMSDDTYRRLKPDQLEIIKTAAREAGAFQNETALKSEKDLLEEFKAGGMTVIQPDKEAFRNKVKDLPKTFQNGALLEIYNKIQAVK
jgi:tripartite ATP-independent transporter DctP family solute receptor